ncbi:hypothetical protein D3C78_458600 [compost metagenome]
MQKKTTPSENISPEKSEPLTCGIIMPISPIDGCSAEHWGEVKQIIYDAVDSIAEPRFTARIVSDADDIGVIQKRIVQGVYNSDIVVCDVSGKNSNVMFELGMRLAFDKPTIIIKDDKTDYSFDTSIIEHLPYPRDLRFSKIVAFKKSLSDKIIATYNAAQSDPEHSTFLKNFGTFKVAHLNQKEASGEQLILEMLSEMQHEVSSLRRESINQRPNQRTATAYSGQKPGNVSEIIRVILKLKNNDKSINIEPSTELMDAVLDTAPDIAKEYNSKSAFDIDFAEACLAAKSFYMSKNS